MNERRLYLGAMAAVALIHIAAIAFLPVLPAQDLPQHLTYARIFQDPTLPLFAALYQLPSELQPYFVPYLVLARLGRWIGLMTALRLILSAYVIVLLVALDALVRAVRPGKNPMTALLGAALIWSPVAAMGFLSFLLCVPVFVLGAALLFRGRPLFGLALVGALLASLHAAAAGIFLVLGAIHFAVAPSRRRAIALVSALAGTALTLAAWHVCGSLGVGEHLVLDREALRRAHGLEFINDWLRLDWSTLPVQLDYLRWTLLGPWRLGGQLVVLAALAVVGWLARAGAPALHRRTVLVFGILAFAAPFGLHAPSEVTFLNLRLLTLAATLTIVLVDPARFGSPLARSLLVVAALAISAHFVVRSVRFAHEAEPALALLDQTQPGTVMSSLVFGGRSRELGKQFRVAHFLPMYFTVLHDGAATQFWARYTDHLPIDYRAGRRPAGTDDWHPGRFRFDQLRDSRYLLVGGCDPDDDSAATCDDERRSQRQVPVRPICLGRWCLYDLAQRGTQIAQLPR
jgi:hypothetical protein